MESGSIDEFKVEAKYLRKVIKRTVKRIESDHLLNDWLDEKGLEGILVLCEALRVIEIKADCMLLFAERTAASKCDEVKYKTLFTETIKLVEKLKVEVNNIT